MSKNMPEVRFKGFEKEWESIIFKDFLDSKDGIRRGPFGSDLKKDFFVPESDYVVYEQQNAIYDRYDTRYNISKEKYEELIKFKVSPEDFIMSGAGTIGRISRVPYNINKGIINQALIRFKINFDKTDSDYFLQFLRSDMMQKKLTSTNPGSAMSNLVPMSEVKQWSFFKPSLEEQQQIGTFFKQLDDTVALQQQLVEQQQQYKKAMMQKMFPQKGERVPKVRFEGFSGEWTELKMGEIFEQTNQYINPQESNLELFSLTIEKGLTQKTARYNREFLVKKADKFKKVGPNEFVYNPMNMTLGAVGFNDFKFSVAVSGYYVTMKINQKNNNEYFRIVLTSPQAIHLYKMYATGSLIEKQRVQFPTFSEIRVKVPVLEEQQKIGAFFKQLDDIIFLHKKKLEDYQQMKKALLQRMFV